MIFFSSSLLFAAFLVPSWPGLLINAQRRGEEEVLRGGGGRRQGSRAAEWNARNVERRLPSTHLEHGSLVFEPEPVCHFDSSAGDYVLVTPEDPSYDAYVADGDKGPGEAVPGVLDDYNMAIEFGSACEQVIKSCPSGGFGRSDSPITGKHFALDSDIECIDLDGPVYALYFGSDILLDCQGHKLENTECRGICRGIRTSGDATLKNCVVEAFRGVGISIVGSANLEHVTASGNGAGIDIGGDASVLDVTAEASTRDGITIRGDATMLEVTAKESTWGSGIRVKGSANFTNITTTNNAFYGLVLEGSTYSFDSVVSCSNWGYDLQLLGPAFDPNLATGDPTCGTCTAYAWADCIGLCSHNECSTA